MNQLDCRKCDGWGCRTCRPPGGEQQDVELRERDAAIAAAVKAEREACAELALSMPAVCCFGKVQCVMGDASCNTAREIADAIRARSKA